MLYRPAGRIVTSENAEWHVCSKVHPGDRCNSPHTLEAPVADGHIFLALLQLVEGLDLRAVCRSADVPHELGRPDPRRHVHQQRFPLPDLRPVQHDGLPREVTVAIPVDLKTYGSRFRHARHFRPRPTISVSERVALAVVCARAVNT